MELTAYQLEILKQKELELLNLFLGICAQLHLRYYILGGTLLGAVRHRGFIPWDDDIDVGMPRKDYEDFLHHAQALLPDGLFLQTHLTDPGYPANFAKLRNSRSTFVEHSLANCPINHGIYIDIFPLDYAPEQGKCLFSLKELLLKLRITDAFVPGKMKRRTKLVRRLSRLLYPSIPEALAKRDALFRSVTTGSFLANHCGAWGKKETVPADWYGEGTVLIFEGLEVRAPCKYHQWLTQVYGDYMPLPPAEKRVPHHHIDAFDPERALWGEEREQL